VSEPEIAIAVLAAGSSTRMREPKQLLRRDGKSLLHFAVDAALASECNPVMVVLGAFEEILRIEIEDLDVLIQINPDWSEGIGSSIRCAVASLEIGGYDPPAAIAITLCDQPFVSTAVVNRLVGAFRESQPLIVASRFLVDGEVVFGVPAIFGRDVYPELLELNTTGAKKVIERYSEQVVFVDVPEAAIDVDTPDDWARLQTRQSS
jgi:molybdenum cofactor cytidylyltransferase